MGVHSLRGYITKIEAKYIKYLEEWEKVAQKIDAEMASYKDYREHQDRYTNLGIQEKEQEHRSKMEKLQEELAEIKPKFEVECEAIKRQSDAIFDKKYKYDPSLIDEKGVYLLQNSIMSIDERIDLAEGYKNQGNMTMYYLVADSLQKEVDKPTHERTEAEARGAAYYQTARYTRDVREDHALIDSMMIRSGVALDVASPMAKETFGKELDLDSVRAFQTQHDALVSEVFELSDNVTANVTTPWE